MGLGIQMSDAGEPYMSGACLCDEVLAVRTDLMNG